MLRIRKSLLQDACTAAEKTLPNEFLCLLGNSGIRGEVNEIIFLPTYTTEISASLNELELPFDDTIIGSLHSHPFSTSRPSLQDKKFFKKYDINIVLGHPFTINNAGFYDKKGNPIKTELI